MNDIVLSAGQPPLGFANPLLYQLYASGDNPFRDIVIGNNTSTEYPNKCRTPGYGAAPGYDACTGLGVPDVSKLLSGVKSMLNIE
jgi:tripeptidyl-peptidase I